MNAVQHDRLGEAQVFAKPRRPSSWEPRGGRGGAVGEWKASVLMLACPAAQAGIAVALRGG
jgi:hypothetical protein